MSWGAGGPWPRRFGGGKRARSVERLAFSQIFEDAGLNPEDPSVGGRVYAFANAVGGIWAINTRLRGAEIPERMLETLTTYEEILRLRPDADDPDVARRQAVAAKLRGLSGNTFADIQAAVGSLLGSQFDGLITVAPADEITYWPGMNPGPPGYEWFSNRMVLGVRIKREGIDAAGFEGLFGQCQALLQDLLPAWEVFAIGVGADGFTVDEDTVDIDFL